MSIVAGKSPDGEPMRSETNPAFKHEEQKHTGQALPPEPGNHPMSDGQVLDMLNGDK